MTARTFVALLLRALGLYFLLTTALALPGHIALMMTPTADEFGGAALFTAANFGTMFALIGRLVVGAVLFLKSPAVSKLLIAEDTGSIALVGGQELYAVALALLGFWLFIAGLEDLAASGTLLYLHEGDERAYIVDRETQTIARGVVAVIAGVVLVVGAIAYATCGRICGAVGIMTRTDA